MVTSKVLGGSGLGVSGGGRGNCWCPGYRKVVLQILVEGIHPPNCKLFQWRSCNKQQLGDPGQQVGVF